MTDRSLSSLYRRLVERPSGAVGDVLDAETLVAAAAGSLRGDRRDDVAMRLAHSPAHTDLVRLLRELEPASAALAAAVQERAPLAHASRGRLLRHAATLRQPGRLRWASLAACMAVALGVVGVMQHRAHVDEEAAIAAAMEAAARPDRIFTSVDRIFSMKDESVPPVDAVFHGDFSGG